jgi:tRNA C32,U32 (ribose-2'-O)-methylase TrmJ
LKDAGFLDPDNPRHLMRRLRRLFIRARPDKNEVNILRGILTAVEKEETSDG